MFTKNFQIKKITCQACVSLSHSVLEEIEGVLKVDIDHQTGQTTLMTDRDITNGQIIEAMRQIDKEVIF